MESNILALTRLSYVPRWVIVPMERTQTVSDHSFRVALICAHLVEGKGWAPGQIGFLMGAAIIHDADEVYTGDIPATAKMGMVTVVPKKSDLLGSIPGPIQFIIKVADIVEAITWFNSYGQPAFRRTGILGSMKQTLNGLMHHPDYDQDVYNRALRLLETGDIE